MSDHVFICTMAQMAYCDKAYVDDCFTSKVENDMNLPAHLSCTPIFFDASETGYCDAQVYICYTQKNELVITCRGTECLSDIITDLKLWRDNLYDIYYHNNFQKYKTTYGIPKVHAGFYEQYHTIKDLIYQHINTYLNTAVTPVIIFTGHSLGGALATIGAACMAVQFKHRAPNIQCYTFGSPKVGNADFVNIFNAFVNQSVRYVNNKDPVPMTPYFGYTHVKGLKHLNNAIDIYKYTFSLIYSDKNDHYMDNYKKHVVLDR
jgi:predicted lipase